MTSKEITNRGELGLSQVGKGLIGLGISAAFVWVALRGVDLGEVWAHLQGIRMRAMVPVLISLAVIFAYKGIRWQYQMSTLKHIAFKRSFGAIVIGYMANNAVPLRGGDLLRAHVLARQENIGTAAVLATVALEHIFELVSLFSVSLAVLLVIPLPVWMRNSVIILGAALIGGAAIIMTFRRWPNLLENYWERGCCLLPHKAQELISVSIKQIRSGLDTARGKVRLTNLYILALGEWLLWGLLVNFSLQAIDMQLSIPAIMSMLVAINLAMMLPAAPGYIGVFDYAAMATLLFYDFDKSIAFSGAVFLHTIMIIPVSLVGLFFFMREWLPPKGLLK